MFKTTLKLLAAALAIFCVVAALQPDTFHVERALVINAPAEKIYAKVSDLHQFNTWSPWAKLDPDAKSSFEGPADGKGAIMHWDGNAEVGAGSMEITQAEPNEFVAFKLSFLKPMKGEATSRVTLTPEGKAVKVTWSMDGHNNFIGKAIGLIFNCETMIGDKYEEGLANLKTVVNG
jgi:uncharacterized protein YndB with AHSA1/START domain